MTNNIFKPTKQKIRKLKIFGFDLETLGQQNTFYCGSIYGEGIPDGVISFFDKREMIEYFKQPLFKNSLIGATNLSFDFFQLFRHEPEEQYFKLIFRGSDLLSAKTQRSGKTWNKHISGQTTEKPVNHANGSLTFIDTMNYGHVSVKNIGKLLELPKLEIPKCLGKIPSNWKEKQEIKTYNQRDAEISCKFIRFLYDVFHELGANAKVTIASTAMSLYKNKFLKNQYFVHPVEVIEDIFKAYYGGRSEVFERGYTNKLLNYYDFNSLYPSVMTKKYPDPNTLRTVFWSTPEYIKEFEGVSMVDIDCPSDMQISLLPVKYTGRKGQKLMFPVGEIRKQWYTHVELRKALQLGYKIIRVYKTHYYRDTCEPFKEYVNTLYELRKQYQTENSPMEYVVKILLNSLYGKFAQKFDNKTEVCHQSLFDFEKGGDFARIDDYVIYKKAGNPANFCFPIWSAYTTAYARIKLFDVLTDCTPLYCDTDSVVTERKFPNSKELGDLKLEHEIVGFDARRPKMYAFQDVNTKIIEIKIKGGRLGRLVDGKIECSWGDWNSFIRNPVMIRDKFVRFKEGLRQHLSVNSIIYGFEKNVCLDDDKRDWVVFTGELQKSTPIHFKEGMPVIDYKFLESAANEIYKDVVVVETRNLLINDYIECKSTSKHL